jgi:hypothetical protein
MGIQTLSGLDRDMVQPLGRILQDAFQDGLVANYVKDPAVEYSYGGIKLNAAAFFANAVKVTATTISFQENTPLRDTITNSAGGFIAAGFLAGQKVVISGSGSNNKSVTLYLVTDTVLTVLDTDDLTAESAGATVVLVTLQKNYLLDLEGDRLAANKAYNDSNDAYLRISGNNYAQNDASYRFRGILANLANRGSGTLDMVCAADLNVRQRSDAGIMSSLLGTYIGVVADVGCGAIGTAIKGIQVEMKLHTNAPANSAGVCVRNYSDGIYTVPTAALAVKNDGTSGCKGFEYILDAYDAAAKTWNTAVIRIGKTDSEDIVITSGNFADGADSGFAPGSIGLDTTDGLVFYTDSAGLWQQIGAA